ncbi:MAG: hypothetical protein A2Z91_00900 [Deltaproteobacteria bacterium GWA2_38_16]|nr:MAG: hypothetical protein A2Z91_00900 [Deltaproteobacteria bacterium GWA2_38_16]OGQ03655.1 MAG: hypothetical protein A3D19_02305 [Deltaproteobacteria bacterium RIFCSPHIGHO2_02_FULL_38_15]OGQ33987.1 MAG: hypothetical protein A3A72_04295 [Deltaproteobacteria bacterium RIFCSPLOWO2_01_FULL_38_9]HBQ21823.1 hypothetical protein [Deltaproteobacteria bacterium]
MLFKFLRIHFILVTAFLSISLGTSLFNIAQAQDSAWKKDPFFFLSQIGADGSFQIEGALPNGTEITLRSDTTPPEIIRIAPLGEGTAIQWGNTSIIHYLPFKTKSVQQIGRHAVLLSETSEIYFIDVDLFAANALDTQAGSNSMAVPVFILPLPQNAPVSSLEQQESTLQISYDGTPPESAPLSFSAEQLDTLMGFELQVSALLRSLVENPNDTKTLIASQLPALEYVTKIKSDVIRTLISDIEQSLRAHATSEEADEAISPEYVDLLKKTLATAHDKDGPLWYFLLSDEEQEALQAELSQTQEGSPLPEQNRRQHFIAELARVREYLTNVEAGHITAFKSTLDPWGLLPQRRFTSRRFHPMGMTVKIEITHPGPHSTSEVIETKSFNLSDFSGSQLRSGIVAPEHSKITKVQLWAQNTLGNTLIHEFYVESKGMVAMGAHLLLLPFEGAQGKEALARTIDLEYFYSSNVIPLFYAPFGGTALIQSEVIACRGSHELVEVDFKNGQTQRISLVGLKQVTQSQLGVFNQLGAMADPDVFNAPFSQNVLETLTNTFFINAAQNQGNLESLRALNGTLNETFTNLLLQPENGSDTDFATSQKEVMDRMREATQALQEANSTRAEVALWLQHINGFHPLNGRWIRNTLLISAALMGAGTAIAAPEATQAAALNIVSAMQAAGEVVIQPLSYIGNLCWRSGHNVVGFFDLQALKAATIDKPLFPIAMTYIGASIVIGYTIAHVGSQFYKLTRDLSSKKWTTFKENWMRLHYVNPSRWRAFKDYFISKEKENIVAFGYMKEDDPKLQTLTFRRACASFIFGFQTFMITQGMMPRIWNAYFKLRNKVGYPFRTFMQVMFPDIQRVVEAGGVPSLANGGVLPNPPRLPRLQYLEDIQAQQDRLEFFKEEERRLKASLPTEDTQHQLDALRATLAEHEEATQDIGATIEFEALQGENAELLDSKGELERELEMAESADKKSALQAQINETQARLKAVRARMGELRDYFNHLSGEEIRKRNLILEAEVNLRQKITEASLKAASIFVSQSGADTKTLARHREYLEAKRKKGKPVTIGDGDALSRQLTKRHSRFYEIFSRTLFKNVFPKIVAYLDEHGQLPDESLITTWLTESQQTAYTAAQEYATASTAARWFSLAHWRFVGQRLKERFFKKIAEIDSRKDLQTGAIISDIGRQRERAALIDRMVKDPKAVKRAAIDNRTNLLIDKPLEILQVMLGYSTASREAPEVAPIQDRLFSNTSVFGAGTVAFGDQFMSGLAMWLLSGTWGIMQTQGALSAQYDAIPPTPEEAAAQARASGATEEEIAKAALEATKDRNSKLRWLIRRTWKNPENTMWYNYRYQWRVIIGNWRAALINMSLLQRAFLGRFDLDFYTGGYIVSFLTSGFFAQIENGFWNSTGWYAKDFTPEQLKDPQVQAIVRARIERAQKIFKIPYKITENTLMLFTTYMMTLPDQMPEGAGVDPELWKAQHARDPMAHLFFGQTPTEWVGQGLESLGNNVPVLDPVTDGLRSFIGLDRPGTYGAYPRLPLPK